VSVRRRTARWEQAAVVGLFALYGTPLLYLVATSLKAPQDVFDGAASLVFRPNLGAYRDVWEDELLTAFKNSALIASTVMVVTTVLATLAAYGLSALRSGAIVNTFLGALIVLQMTPQANSVLPLFRVMADLNLLGGVRSVILADTALLLPFATILLRPFFASIPPEIHEAARIDGASRWRSFVHVALPLARNGIVTVATLVWIIAWGEFLYAISFTTRNSQLPLAGVLSKQVTEFGIDWTRLMAVSSFIVLPVLVVFLLTQRRLTEGLTVGTGK
jgi:multiple sugar transport system permease protein